MFKAAGLRNLSTIKFYLSMINFRANRSEREWLREFTQMHNLYFEPLCFFAASLLKDSGNAEDIVSDLFLKTWEKRFEFKTVKSVKAFLYISTRNACLNFLVQNKYRRGVLDKYKHSLKIDDDYVLNRIVRTEVLSELSELIKTLPRQCRNIVEQKFIGNQRNEIVAERMGLSIHTVRNQAVRGIGLLKKRLLDIEREEDSFIDAVLSGN